MSRINTVARVHADHEFAETIVAFIGLVVLIAVFMLAAVWMVDTGVTLPAMPMSELLY